MHDQPLPQCEIFQKQLSIHLEESKPVRDSVSKSCQQILTLEKAHEATMADIRDMKEDLADIKTSIQDMQASVKLWVLGGVVSTIVVFAFPVFGLIYSLGQNTNKIDVNNGRLQTLEEMHPRTKL